jgi:biotin transport system substrate-specific component
MLNKTAIMQKPISERYFSEFSCLMWGTFLMFFASQISIPLEPVPITLQTFGVMLLGLIFERKTAIKSVALYLSLGALGVPVFANFSGSVVNFAGPTGGYLIGFLACVIVMTTVRQRLKSEHFVAIALNALLGTFVIMGFGVAWLSVLIGVKPAMHVGLLPFIVPGIMKALLLAIVVRFLRLDKIHS